MTSECFPFPGGLRWSENTSGKSSHMWEAQMYKTCLRGSHSKELQMVLPGQPELWVW